jgi:putative peptidoglycan lipid II flippase
VIAGAILQTLILAPGLRGDGYGVSLLFDFANRHLREVVRLLIPNGLAVSVNYAGFIVDTAFATRAADTASLAAIYNAFLLVGLPIALLGQAIGQAAFPRLAAQAEAGNWTEMRKILLRSLGAAIGLAIPALAALLFLGRPTIRILFEHGEFTHAAGDLTYSVLVAYALGLPAYVATEVITRGLISLRDTRSPLLTNSGQLILRIILISILLNKLGAVAIPAAFAIASTAEALAQAFILFVKLRGRLQAQPVAASMMVER